MKSNPLVFMMSEHIMNTTILLRRSGKADEITYNDILTGLTAAGAVTR
ncbi:hypothetical protein AB0395_37090 [Streptosporangium sp. NPDC051023]